MARSAAIAFEAHGNNAVRPTTQIKAGLNASGRHYARLVEKELI